MDETTIAEVENWMPVPGWPEYAVSDLGRVRRVAGHGTRNRSGILKPSWRDRYLGVTLYRKTEGGRIKRTENVHVLVLRAFAGDPPAGHIADHGDRDRSNNRRSNLDWVTPAENNRRAVAAGRPFAKGEKVGGKVLDCAAIIASRTPTFGERRIAKKFGISRDTVRSILAGEHWSQKQGEIL